jgi:hypothetical protein|nr:MAG TPA: Baseplate structural protein [Caudoviricetes sp.]
MPHQIETLKKIEYVDLQQFVELINYNFAVLENSPFFKGIPGKKGQKGETGIKGTRGIRFLFVNYTLFNQEYPNEINSAQLIDLEFINRKLAAGNVNSADKQKFLNALNTTDLVVGDVIVLTNTKLLSFNGVEFEDTNIAFDSNYGNNKDIQEIIKEYVDNFILNNEKIKSIKNIFHSYLSHAKNYQDVSNTLITNSITSKSVYEPYIKGNKKGIEVLTHKYIGYSSDILTNDEQKSTVILGSVNKYIKILQNTFGTDLNKTLISDYSPGVGNEPTMVVLQNDLNSGLMIGYRDALNFKSFGRIFRNYDNEFIIESNVGLNSDEKGTLKLHNEYLNWDKNAKFERNVEVSHDLFIGLNINSKLIRTGEFTPDKKTYELYLGPKDKKTDSKTVNTSFIEQYTHYIDNVLVTDNDGIVLKKYSIEKGGYEIKEDNPLNQISTSISSENKLVTSNYFGLLTKKVNILINKVSQDYWTKKDFTTGVIPKLVLSEQLQIGNNIIKSNEVNFGSNTIISQNLTLTSFKNNVLVTDNTGKIVNTYSLENSDITSTELELFNQINVNSDISSENKILSSKYFNYLTTKINKLINKIKSDYYTKDDWKTPTLSTSPKEIKLSNVNITISGTSNVLYENSLLLSPSEIRMYKPTYLHNQLYLQQYNDGILSVSNKQVVSRKFTDNIFNETATEDVGVIISDENSVISGKTLNSVLRKISAIVGKLNSVWREFYTKSQWQSGTIEDWIKPKLLNVLKTFSWTNNGKKVEFNDNNIIIRPQGNQAGLLQIDSNGIVSIGTAGIPVGTVITWAGNNFLPSNTQLGFTKNDIPDGWYLCDGTTVTINGVNMKTPDLRNRFIMGSDVSNEDMEAFTQDDYQFGEKGGENFSKIKWNQLPPHSHKMFVNMNHNHSYQDTVITDNRNSKSGGDMAGFNIINIPGDGRANGEHDNYAFYRKAITDNFSENRRVYPETYTELSRSEPKNKGDVWNPEKDVFRLSSNYFLGQRYWQKTSEASYKEVSDQKQYDNRPAYFELVYLIYFGK